MVRRFPRFFFESCLCRKTVVKKKEFNQKRPVKETVDSYGPLRCAVGVDLASE